MVSDSVLWIFSFYFATSSSWHLNALLSPRKPSTRFPPLLSSCDTSDWVFFTGQPREVCDLPKWDAQPAAVHCTHSDLSHCVWCVQAALWRKWMRRHVNMGITTASEMPLSLPQNEQSMSMCSSILIHTNVVLSIAFTHYRIALVFLVWVFFLFLFAHVFFSQHYSANLRKFP